MTEKHFGSRCGVRWFGFFVSLAYMFALWRTRAIWEDIAASRPRMPPWNGVLLLSLVSILALGQLYVSRLDVFASAVFVAAVSSFPEKSIAESTKGSLAGASKTLDRAKTLDAVPSLADALNDATITAGHVDVVTRAGTGLA